MTRNERVPRLIHALAVCRNHPCDRRRTKSTVLKGVRDNRPRQRQLHGQVAFVTGTTSGIVRATALAFARG